MLEGLNEIDWSELGHAYGAAIDVPDMLRALATGDEALRRKTQSDLWGNIYHQGTVYEATAYAVPFFLELLQADVAEKDFLLYYLAHLAHGTSYHDVHQRFYSEDDKDAEFFETMRLELHWVAEVKRKVLDGRPIYERLLADGEPVARGSAAYLLSSLVSLDASSVKPIYGRLPAETDPAARACLILALRADPNPPDDLKSTLMAEFDRDSEPLVRFAAAIAILKLLEQASPAPVVRYLSDVIAAPGELEQAFSELPWGEGGVRHHAAQALTYLGSEARFALPVLLDFLRSRKPGCLAVAEDVVIMALGLEPFPAGTKASDLDDMQRQVLQALLDVQPPKTTYGDITSIFEAYGLPGTNDKMRAFLSAR